MMTDIIFDFFGTLVNYSHGITDKTFANSHAYLQAQGFSITYQAFLDGWDAAFEVLEQQAQVDYHEYHMRDAAQQFITNTFQTEVDQAVYDTLVAYFIDEWNAGVTYHPGIKGFLTKLAENFTSSLKSFALVVL